jgi:hypothetical protein
MESRRRHNLKLLFLIYMCVLILATACSEWEGGGGDAGGGAVSPTPGAAEPTDAATTPPTITPSVEPKNPNTTGVQENTGDNDVFKEIVQNTRPGQVAFNVPLKMKVNDASLVELLITDDLQRNLQKELSDNKGKVETAQLQVSSALRARLEGINFSIKSFNEENRLLVKNGVAAWRWSVTPIEPGEQNLYLSIYARVKRNNASENVDLKTFQRLINVSVSPTGWLNQNWKWVVENSAGIGAIVAGIFVFIVTRWKWIRVKLKKMKKQSSNK